MRLPIPCPWCGARLDRHDSASDLCSVPEPGDVLLCWPCGHASVVEADGTSARRPTADEVEAWLDDPVFRAAVEGVGAARGPIEAAERSRARYSELTAEDAP